jgi:hypothetical protein
MHTVDFAENANPREQGTIRQQDGVFGEQSGELRLATNLRAMGVDVKVAQESI